LKRDLAAGAALGEAMTGTAQHPGELLVKKNANSSRFMVRRTFHIPQDWSGHFRPWLLRRPAGGASLDGLRTAVPELAAHGFRDAKTDSRIG